MSLRESFREDDKSTVSYEKNKSIKECLLSTENGKGRYFFMKVNVLGTEYQVEFRKKSNDNCLKDADGYCDSSIKLIVVEDFVPDDKSKGDLKMYSKCVLRHEIIHAFLHESGLEGSLVYEGSWAGNEEMVDWFAFQSPKIFKAFQEVGAM